MISEADFYDAANRELHRALEALDAGDIPAMRQYAARTEALAAQWETLHRAESLTHEGQNR